MIYIDGSRGEGGGQVLRTALALSLVTGQPFKMTKIRAGRKKPGLKRQHLTCVRAAVEIGSARVSGDELNSQSLEFYPGKVKGGSYRFSVGSAGSASLVLQTVLPPLMLAAETSHIVLEGGTHNPWAPPYDFLERCFFPQLKKCGVDIESELVDYGFFPAGGGRFKVCIQPVEKLQGFDLLERGQLKSRLARALVADIPHTVAEREVNKACRSLGWSTDESHAETVERVFGPGNVLMLEENYENVSELVISFGERGIRAEQVAIRAVRDLRHYLEGHAPVGEYLADQLLIPLALAGEGSFVCTEVSEHTRTNIEVIKSFIDVEVNIQQLEKNAFLVEIKK